MIWGGLATKGVEMLLVYPILALGGWDMGSNQVSDERTLLSQAHNQTELASPLCFLPLYVHTSLYIKEYIVLFLNILSAK